jgi:ubiquinone/menaquinone biosynthesis C-methylase UbiE
MPEVNLLDLYPRAKRNIQARAAATAEDRRIAKQFGKEYFDGTRNQGYGGYYYDGRWKSIVKVLQDYYQLDASSKVLDVGSGKGFMLHDLVELIPGISVTGVEISPYGIEQTMPSVKPFIIQGTVEKLPFPDHSFDLVTAINTIHNLKGEALKTAIREIERVSRKGKFIVVDAYRDEAEKEKIMDWVLTAETVLRCDEWEALFKKWVTPAITTGFFHKIA